MSSNAGRIKAVRKTGYEDVGLHMVLERGRSIHVCYGSWLSKEIKFLHPLLHIKPLSCLIPLPSSAS